jgi:hypothetical protein
MMLLAIICGLLLGSVVLSTGYAIEARHQRLVVEAKLHAAILQAQEFATYGTALQQSTARRRELEAQLRLVVDAWRAADEAHQNERASGGAPTPRLASRAAKRDLHAVLDALTKDVYGPRPPPSQPDSGVRVRDDASVERVA